MYQQRLVNLGWDDLAFLRTRSEAQLKDIAASVGMKPGHTAKFFSLSTLTISLQDFLQERGLSMYQQRLVNLGWDDLSVLRTRSEAQLKDIAAFTEMNPGHTAKFIVHILST